MPFDSQTDHCLEDRSKYTLEQIGDMPHWIDKQKNAIIPEMEDRPGPIELQKMNDNQSSF